MATEMALVQTNLHFKRLTLTEAVAYIVGTNVGAAVLALPYAARQAGYPGIVAAAVLATFFSIVSHLYIAESMLRTPSVTQLVGLFRTYLFKGRAKGLYLWFLFIMTIGVAIPTLTSYIIGGAQSISAILGISTGAAQCIFLVPGMAIVWLGLKATGVLQKAASLLMGAVLLLLTLLSLGHQQAILSRLAHFDAGAFWPILPVAIFTCLSQNTVPEVVRGLAHEPRLVPKAIVYGLLINFVFVLVVPLSVFALLPADKIAEVATTSWGRALGLSGLIMANCFAFFALLTSFWGTAGTILTNIVDVLKLPSEWHLGYRLLSFAITLVPSLIIILCRFTSFVDLIKIAGSIGGVLLALLPVLVLWRARRHGARSPEYIAPAWLGRPVQAGMILFYLGTMIYAALAL